MRSADAASSRDEMHAAPLIDATKRRRQAAIAARRATWCNEADVKEILGQYKSKSYLCIIANLNKEPIAVKPNTSVRVVPSYNTIAQNEEINGRLFIRGLQPKVNEILSTIR